MTARALPIVLLVPGYLLEAAHLRLVDIARRDLLLDVVHVIAKLLNTRFDALDVIVFVSGLIVPFNTLTLFHAAIVAL